MFRKEISYQICVEYVKLLNMVILKNCDQQYYQGSNGTVKKCSKNFFSLNMDLGQYRQQTHDVVTTSIRRL